MPGELVKLCNQGSDGVQDGLVAFGPRGGVATTDNFFTAGVEYDTLGLGSAQINPYTHA
jgi:hypothetical protein